MEGRSQWRHSARRCLWSRAETAKLLSPSCARRPSAQRSTGSVSLTPRGPRARGGGVEFQSPGSCLPVTVPVASPDGPSSRGPAHSLPVAGTGRGEVGRLKEKQQLMIRLLGASVGLGHSFPQGRSCCSPGSRESGPRCAERGQTCLRSKGEPGPREKALGGSAPWLLPRAPVPSHLHFGLSSGRNEGIKSLASEACR